MGYTPFTGTTDEERAEYDRAIATHQALKRKRWREQKRRWRRRLSGPDPLTAPTRHRLLRVVLPGKAYLRTSAGSTPPTG